MDKFRKYGVEAMEEIKKEEKQPLFRCSKVTVKRILK